MSRHPELFTPITLGGVTLPNRLVVAPMCQYSAEDGRMTDWHLQHLGTFACSGAALFVVEATGVTPEGRITPRCTGLYDDATEAAMARPLALYRSITRNPIGIQLAHAGRKASTSPPFLGGRPLSAGEGAWQTVAPSAIPFGEGWHTPRELSIEEIGALKDDFVEAAKRALRLGFDVVELHSAHGYLLHQFLSPLVNRRKDEYGRDRMKFPLEVVAAVRAAWPKERCLGVRINASDWADGGFTVEDAIPYVQELKRHGVDYVCVSSGATVPHARIPATPGYQVPFAEKIRESVGIAVRAVGLIADADQAQAIVASGQADMVAMARAFLDNPRWVWHAAERLGVKIGYPPQYARSRGDSWPGAQIARPKELA